MNDFDTLEKYIDYVHIVDDVPLKAPTDLHSEIKILFKKI